LSNFVEQALYLGREPLRVSEVGALDFAEERGHRGLVEREEASQEYLRVCTVYVRRWLVGVEGKEASEECLYGGVYGGVYKVGGG